MIFPPEDQRAWYPWLTNQAGHSALVGMPAALVLLPFWGPIAAPIAVALVYFVAWEWLVQDLGAGIGDALNDTACVMAGAATLCGAVAYGYWTAAACMAFWSVFLGIGVLRRA